MADDVDSNPFAAIDPRLGLADSPTVPNKDEENPFSVFGPPPDAPQTSAAGAFAAPSVLPAAGGFVAAGYGAAQGAAIGAFGGPLDWATVPLGGLIGGVAG